MPGCLSGHPRVFRTGPAMHAGRTMEVNGAATTRGIRSRPRLVVGPMTQCLEQVVGVFGVDALSEPGEHGTVIG
ncbi:MAG: hypothetical protein JWO67_1235 [Streptosporangiaceae bacterium]|nr:hypothetical protein [Streptosporangiaceae bacterium]